jgi:hypothetical protein
LSAKTALGTKATKMAPPAAAADFIKCLMSFTPNQFIKLATVLDR